MKQMHLLTCVLGCCNVVATPIALPSSTDATTLVAETCVTCSTEAHCALARLQKAVCSSCQVYNISVGGPPPPLSPHYRPVCQVACVFL